MLRTLSIALVAAVALASHAGAQQIYKGGDAGVTLPVVEKSVRPEYTPEAMKARIEGTVLLDGIVLTDGSVAGGIMVSRSLDTVFGLDQEAVKALEQWTFKPGMRDGKPVPVAITVEMSFMLK